MTLSALAVFALLVAAATLRAVRAPRPGLRARGRGRGWSAAELPEPPAALDLVGARAPVLDLRDG